MSTGSICNHVYPTSTGGSANMPGPIVDGKQTFVPVPQGHPLPGTDCKLCGSRSGWADSSNPYGIPFPFYFQEEEMMNSDPTEGDPTEFEVEVERDPVFCSYLKDNNEMCRAKKPSPCGRHDSDKQKRQEARLKEMVVDAFNKIHEANYSVADLGLSEDASAFDFLSAVFYYLDINEDRVEHSPYMGMPVTIESEHDHRRSECWNQSTYDSSYYCRFCDEPGGQTPPWM